MNDLEIALVIQNMFFKLEHPMEDLTEWEQTFIESIKRQFEQKGSLSAKQREILERIYDEKAP